MPAIIFETTCHTHHGEHVLVVGSHPLAGHWNPLQSEIVLRTGDATYPVYPLWSSSADLPEGVELEFKFAVLRGSDARWEDHIENRSLLVPSTPAVLRTIFNVPGEIIELDETSPANPCTSRQTSAPDATNHANMIARNDAHDALDDAAVELKIPVGKGTVEEQKGKLGDVSTNTESSAPDAEKHLNPNARKNVVEFPVQAIDALDGEYLPVTHSGAKTTFTISGDHWVFESGTSYLITNKTPTFVRRQGYHGEYRVDAIGRLVADDSKRWKKSETKDSINKSKIVATPPRQYSCEVSERGKIALDATFRKAAEVIELDRAYKATLGDQLPLQSHSKSQQSRSPSPDESVRKSPKENNAVSIYLAELLKKIGRRSQIPVGKGTVEEQDGKFGDVSTNTESSAPDAENRLNPIAKKNSVDVSVQATNALDGECLPVDEFRCSLESITAMNFGNVDHYNLAQDDTDSKFSEITEGEGPSELALRAISNKAGEERVVMRVDIDTAWLTSLDEPPNPIGKGPGKQRIQEFGPCVAHAGSSAPDVPKRSTTQESFEHEVIEDCCDRWQQHCNPDGGNWWFPTCGIWKQIFR